MSKTFLNMAIVMPSLVGAFVLGTLCQNENQELRAGCNEPGAVPASPLWTPVAIDSPSSVESNNEKMLLTSQFRVEPCNVEQETRCDNHDGTTRYQVQWDDSKQELVFLGDPQDRATVGKGARSERKVLNSFNSPMDRLDSPLHRRQMNSFNSPLDRVPRPRMR